MLYTHQAEVARGAQARRGHRRRHADRLGQVAVLQPAGAPGGRRGPAARALYLFPTKALSQDQLAALRELADAGGHRRRRGRLRRRHARADPAQHPRRRPGRGHQPGHAPLGDPAPSHEVVPALRAAALRRRRRDALVPRHLRQPRRQRAAAAACGSAPTTARKPQIICCSATIGNPGELAEIADRPAR